MAGKYRLTTLGCKVNQYESEVLRGILIPGGWTHAENGGTADLHLIIRSADTEPGTFNNMNKRSVRRAARTRAQVLAEPRRLSKKVGGNAVGGDNVHSRTDPSCRLGELMQFKTLSGTFMAGNSSLATGTKNAGASAKLRSDAGVQRSGAPASAAHRSSSGIIPLIPESVKNSSDLLDRLDTLPGHKLLGAGRNEVFMAWVLLGANGKPNAPRNRASLTRKIPWPHTDLTICTDGAWNA